MTAYSLTITKYDPSVRAHRESTVWIYRDRKLTTTGIQRIVRKNWPGSNLVRVERWAVQS
jgi:hypothetical protein